MTFLSFLSFLGNGGHGGGGGGGGGGSVGARAQYYEMVRQFARDRTQTVLTFPEETTPQDKARHPLSPPSFSFANTFSFYALVYDPRDCGGVRPEPQLARGQRQARPRPY